MKRPSSGNVKVSILVIWVHVCLDGACMCVYVFGRCMYMCMCVWTVHVWVHVWVHVCLDDACKCVCVFGRYSVYVCLDGTCMWVCVF